MLFSRVFSCCTALILTASVTGERQIGKDNERMSTSVSMYYAFSYKVKRTGPEKTNVARTSCNALFAIGAAML
jgi:hypothetical protein